MRVMCSRDELRNRPPALPPVQQTFAPTRALFPIDPISGGTWIAVNNAGLVMVLLNRNPTDTRGIVFQGKLSRGGIIPSLLHAESLSQALAYVEQIDNAPFPPFRLVLSDARSLIDVKGGGGGSLSIQQNPFASPQMFTSSGLGDGLVEQPRRDLFTEMFSDDSKSWHSTQEAFHGHQWDDRPELSVAMEREDAMTVSVTTINVSAETVTLIYHPAPPRVESKKHVVKLQITRAARL